MGEPDERHETHRCLKFRAFADTEDNAHEVNHDEQHDGYRVHQFGHLRWVAVEDDTVNADDENKECHHLHIPYAVQFDILVAFVIAIDGYSDIEKRQI